jgi:cell division septum initiation protein DivIVA
VVTPVPVPDSDVIQRTLILAQKAADEAVAEAQAKAAQLTNESEAKAAALVSEAESTARRIAESERRRIEAEIAQLGATRDALVEDVDVLDRFSADYRDRIRLAIEAELLHLSASSGNAEPPPVRPALQTEGMTFATAAPATAPAPAPAPAPAAESRPVFVVESESTMAVEAVTAETPEVVDLAGAEADEPPAWNAAGNSEAAWSPEPAGGWGGDDDYSNLGAGSPDEYGAESLDDDAFFASLRDAVREDEPLGPRDDDYYDDEDAEGGKKLFRRRR